jgi:glutathionylspermidine synthase
MERVSITPRIGWEAKVEGIGFSWHTPNGEPYWDESGYWKLSDTDVDTISAAVKDGYAMLIEAIDFVIKGKQLPLFGYTDAVIEMIEQSWANRANEIPLIGCFNIAYDGTQAKILSFNADSPKALFETAMVQTNWVVSAFPTLPTSPRQFNFLAPRISSQFQKLSILNRTQTHDEGWSDSLHFTCMTPDPQAEAAAGFLQQCATLHGIQSSFVGLPDIGWQEGTEDESGFFVDKDNKEISTLVRAQTPLGMLLQDEFGESLGTLVDNGELTIMESAWTMLASNKRLLATMWDRNAYHPALLNTAVTPLPQGYAKKPYNGFDGQNITMFDGKGATLDQTEGSFAEDQFVFQELAPTAKNGDDVAVFCIWTVDGAAAGIGIRESGNPITDAAARFVPHIVE